MIENGAKIPIAEHDGRDVRNPFDGLLVAVGRVATQAFQSVRYPILPVIETAPSTDPACPGCVAELLHVRHHSLFVPRDLDVSPYFEVVKPTLAAGFDPHRLIWAERGERN